VQAVYYRDPNGREPVNDFVDGLAPERQEEIDFKISLPNRVANNDPPLPFGTAPRSTASCGSSAATTGATLYRILYQRSGNLFVLLQAMEKRTGALPQADIDIARKRFEDFRARMEQPPRPPRPAGHDAP
jgi:phage-related protein